VQEGLVSVFFVALIHPASRTPTLEGPRQPVLDAAGETNDIVVLRQLLPDEARVLAIRACDEDPLRDERVRVRVEPRRQRSAEQAKPWRGESNQNSTCAG